MGFWELGGARRIAVIAVFAAALLLAWCGVSSLMPQPGDTNAGFQTQKQFAAAYARVAVGRTPASQLARIGFDPRAPGTQILAYFGAVERFMPHDSFKFDDLDPAMQSCLEARDRCTAYIFHLTGWQGPVTKNGMPKLIDPASAALAPRRAQVILLVRDGRVAYKAIEQG